MSKAETEERVIAVATRLSLTALMRARRQGEPSVIAVETSVLDALLKSPPAMRQPSAWPWPHARAMRERFGHLAFPDPAVVEANLAVRLAHAVERIADTAIRDELALEAAVASMVD